MSLIVALMQARCSRPVHTFAIGFDEKRYDETAYARAVANHLGTAHSELVVQADDALALVPETPVVRRAPRHPLANSGHDGLGLARREVTVALSGDGGDELFGGYPGYYIVRAVHRATGGLRPTLRQFTADAVDVLVDGIAAACTAPFRQPRAPALWANRVKQITSVVRAGGGISEFYAQLYSSVEGPPRCSGRARRAPDALAGHAIPGRRRRSHRSHGCFAILGPLVDGTLAKWDRASMACSLEVRVPFLDHRVVEFAWRLPPALKYNQQGGQQTAAAPPACIAICLPELVDRPKKGFSSPLPVWLRGPLRPWAEELLDERALRDEGIFEFSIVRKCWREHLTATADHWQLL